MAPTCPKCGSKMTPGRTISFQDLARATVKLHRCKNKDCGHELMIQQ
jgi:uncharacterized OB-fold protein